MGRQIGFFMLKEDETELINYVKAKGFQILPRIIKKLPVTPLDKIKETEWTFYLYHPQCKKPAYKHVETQKYYSIDSSSSEVIEVSRSKIDKSGCLCEGRLWIATSYVTKNLFGELKWNIKSIEFVKLYNLIANKIKKEYVKYGSGYLSPKVEKWLEKGNKIRLSGGKFVLTFYDLKKIKKKQK